MIRRSGPALLILVASLAVLVVLAVAAAIPPADQQDPSSRAPGKLGTLALYTWFSRLGLPVQRVSGTFDLSATDILVCYDPTVGFTGPDVDAVIAHLSAGGDVVLVVGPESVAAATPLLNRLGIEITGTLAAGTAAPAQPFDSTDRVQKVPVGAGFAIAGDTVVPLLIQNGDIVAGMVRVGNGGRAYVLGDTQPLSNDGLRNGDSPYLALSLLQRARGGRVAFDEYHHGEGGGATGPAAIFSGPVGVASALAAIVVLLALAINGRRLGPPAPAAGRAVVPSATAYVTAMGQLFARSRRRGPIAEYYAVELKRHIGTVSGIDWHLDDATFAAALTATGAERAGHVVALIARARTLAAGRSDEAQLLRLARDVDTAERAWVAAPVT